MRGAESGDNNNNNKAKGNMAAMLKYEVRQYPCSVVVTNWDPCNLLDQPELKEFRFPFGNGEDYQDREAATQAARWFVKFAAPILERKAVTA